MNPSTGQNLSSNVIGGNSQYGVEISGNLASYNQILGNFHRNRPESIVQQRQWRWRVFITDGSSNTIGGTSKGAGNVVTNNGAALGLKGFGVTVTSGLGRRNPREFHLRQRRSRHRPGQQPGPPLQHPGGRHSPGPNNQENYLVETAVQTVPGFNIITWTLNSTPNSSFDIDFFANSKLTGIRLRRRPVFLQYADHVTTDASGNATFTSVILSVYQYISATATDSLGNTSEFLDGEFRGASGASPTTWKIDGIDLDGDGTIDFKPPDATPMHKDIYIEVDAMNGFAPLPLPADEEPDIPADLMTGTYLDLVVAAFYNAHGPGSRRHNWHQLAHPEFGQTGLSDDIWNDQPEGVP